MFTSAELIRSVRRCADVSQRELADAAEVAKSTVTRIETGEVDPTFAMLDKLLRAVDCRIQVLGPDRKPVMHLDDGDLRDKAGRRYPAHLDVHLPRSWEHGVRPPRRTPFPRARFYLRRRVRDVRREQGWVDARVASFRNVPAHPPLFPKGYMPRRLRKRLR